jgi:hypothetical protein
VTLVAETTWYVASMLQSVTPLTETKFVPVSVTVAPTTPDDGEKLVKVGGRMT